MATTRELNGPTLDWPAIGDHDTVTQRLAAYIANPLRSDLDFYIETEEVLIPGHSFIIGVGSPVLERIVYGAVHIGGSKRIPVSNISQVDFLEVIRYIYTDQSNLTENNAIPIMHVAHYYDLKKLEMLCEDILQSSLNEMNVCSIFEAVHLLENEIAKDCLEFIAENTSDLLVNGTLMAMGVDALSIILGKDALRIYTEYQLFEAMHRYAKQTCVNNGLPVTGGNMREILKGRLEFVRFPTMDAEEFAKCIRLEGNLLSSNEIVDIRKYMATGSGMLKYSTIPRDMIVELIHMEQLKTYEPRYHVDYKDRENCFSETQEIVARKPVKIYGFVLYCADECIVVSSKDRTLKTRISDNYNYRNTFNVFFRNPVLVAPETPFKFKIDYADLRTSWIEITKLRQDKVIQMAAEVPFDTRIFFIFYKEQQPTSQPCA